MSHTIAAMAPANPTTSRNPERRRPVSTLYTIGYERLLPPELVAELQHAGVERLIDVRFRPQSRRPGMSKTRLGELLGDHGIAYEHRRAVRNPPGIPSVFRPCPAAAGGPALPEDVETRPPG